MTIHADAILTLDLLGGKRPERFHGTPAEIVRTMNDTAFAPTADSRAYMERFARFAGWVQGQRIRTDSEAVFLEDLFEVGLARWVVRGGEVPGQRVERVSG